MFNPLESNKQNFILQAKAAREIRANEKRRENAAIIIQKFFRRHITRKNIRANLRIEFLKLFKDFTGEISKPVLPPVTDVYQNIKACLFHLDFMREDQDKVLILCRYLAQSMACTNLKSSYLSIGLNKNTAIEWISHIKKILDLCCQYLSSLKVDHSVDTKAMMLCLHTLLICTSSNTWRCAAKLEGMKDGLNRLASNFMGHLVNDNLYSALKRILWQGLSRQKSVLNSTSLSACLTLAVRPLSLSDFSPKVLSMFLINVLSTPALLLQLEKLCSSAKETMKSKELFCSSLKFLSNYQNSKIIFSALEANYALCLMANIITLATWEKDFLLDASNSASFIHVISLLMESCQQYVMNKQSNLTHWHSILGWFAQPLDSHLNDSLPLVKIQLQLLWGHEMVQILFSQLVSSNEISNYECSYPSSSDSDAKILPNRILRKVLDKKGKSNSLKCLKLGSKECTGVVLVCSLYYHALSTLTQLRLDILTGLCYKDILLKNLWQFLMRLGPSCGLKQFLDHLTANPQGCVPEFHFLILFCDCLSHLIVILDDVELYEKQSPFLLSDLATLSHFLNNFLFKIVWNNLIDLKQLSTCDIFNSMQGLLLLLYQRDSRRSYCPSDHFLIKDIKPSSFIMYLEKGKKPAQILLCKMPHIISHEERVTLFRKYVSNERSVLGITESVCASPHSTVISVHRNRIVEDGYRQLALLPPAALKGIIRVKFINVQGLDEAGIDQDGVFKEFLEETIKKVFDPGLNLFKLTSEERLYPSPTSQLQDNHLQLFEFVGRMLGKAVYEGIVVDVPFASFFLSQVIGNQTSSLYSCMDELPSLDHELYKSLTYIKHYEGDVGELDLTFSYDEDYLGRIVTHELRPGGKIIPVNNENKISYIHLMAHFRMHTQIKEQTAAFIKGFRSIISPDWLALFSTPEVQRLISGDTGDIDLDDLRRHTQYYGGFHDRHRVVLWLWETLKRDFTEDERKLFLKFVTSCSKPPLLGFNHLEPPFAIRCVEVGDDEDTGDTIGSVIRGFLTIRKKDPVNRLPTSSTCFNLLKLPNYQKKSTLKEKLRYAISSNTGFELS